MTIPPNYLGATIFLMDGGAGTTKQLKPLLEQAGYANVVNFDRPAQLLDAHRDLEPDLVVLDPNNPEIDGLSVMNELTRRLPAKGYLPVMVVTADKSKEAKQRALGAGAKVFLTRPFDPTEVLLHINNLLETRFLHKELRQSNHDLENMVQGRTADLWDAVKTLEATDKELRLAQEETIRRLSLAGEFREVQTPQHVERMGRYCERLARLAGLDEEQVELIRLASPMHDIGKIGIPDRVLMKPSALTPEERMLMERHTEIGHRILSGSNSTLLDCAATIALTHHERFDGGGYPQGLSGKDIPLEGRIAAIGDVFDAMLSARPYRRGLPIDKAFRFMKEGRGTQFDPHLMDIFLESASVFFGLSMVQAEASA